MITTLEQLSYELSIMCPVEQDIRSNIAWLGHISGLKAEKLLRNHKTPFLYVLREGEYEGDYYVTFVSSDFSIKHQPFTITITETGWYYENGGGGPISSESRLDDLLYLIMHCRKKECIPLKF